MRILITSYAFTPSIGGVETVTRLMAGAFTKMGHEVKIITHTRSESTSPDEFHTIRKPSHIQLVKVAKWADIVWQNGIALSYLWVPILLRKPRVVTLAGAIYFSLPHKTFKQRIKAFVLRFCHVMAISPYVLQGMSIKADIVGNPFENPNLESDVTLSKTKDFVFVGRLVSDKGADLLVYALKCLRSKGKHVTCSFIGDGPEREKLEAEVITAGLSDSVKFKGYLKGTELYNEISRHKVMIVPSRWDEPFGVVALEGIACGCVVIGSEGGGLPLAIGDSGFTFPNNDLKQLVYCMETVIGNEDLHRSLTSNSKDHLAKFDISAQAEHYIKVFEALITGKSPEPYPHFRSLPKP